MSAWTKRWRAEQFHPELRPVARLLPVRLVRRRTLPAVRRATHLVLRGDRAFTTWEVNATTSVRLYRPDAAPATSAALLWIHGGGLVVGTARQDETALLRLADDLGITVASVDYRLAPESPYPAALEDCYAALEWLAARPDVDETRLAVGGASAGGGLAAATALAARDRQGPALRHQVLLYPMLDDRTTLRPDPDPWSRRLWDAPSNQMGWRSYLGDAVGADDLDHLAAPARCADLAGLPPAWIGVGTLDLFLEEDLAYAERLAAAGVPVQTVVVPGAFHSFDAATWTAVAKNFTAQWTEALRDALT